MTRRSDESGMTLIELLMSVAILGLIIGPVAASLMLSFMTSRGTREMINDSASAQLLASYAPTDIQSARYIFVPPYSPAPGVTCGEGEAVLRLEWDDADPATSGPASQTIISYTRISGSAEGDTLRRTHCDGSGATIDTAAVVRSLAPADEDGVVVTCVRDDAVASCPTGVEIGTPSPVRTVAMAIKVDNPTARDSIYEAFEFRIDGTRRVT